MVWSPVLMGVNTPEQQHRDGRRILAFRANHSPVTVTRWRPGPSSTPHAFGAAAPASTIEKTEVRP